MDKIREHEERILKLERAYNQDLYRSRAGFISQPGKNRLGQDTEIKGNLLISGILTADTFSVSSMAAHTHQSDAQGGKIDHGAGISGLLDDDHPQYFDSVRHTLGEHTGLGLVANSRSIAAGDGLAGGGDLSANRTIYVNPGHGIEILSDAVAVKQSENFTWGGAHTFQGGLTTRHIMPELTDTYDLGSSVKLWRKGWLSELDTVLFAENTMTLLGGWFTVGKGQGSLPADISDADLIVDFGQIMTVGHFVVFRSSLQAEYMKVGDKVYPADPGNYEYYVDAAHNGERGVGGTGANNWPSGSVYLILGTTGDGRIELNAYDTPRISLIKQGATYNAQSEIIRIGDLNGMPGVSTETFGAFIGDASQYLKYANGVLTIAGDGSGLTSIDGGNIQTNTITATQIAANTITSAQIAANTITTTELNANAINGMTITGSILRTAASGARTEMNHNNLFGLGFGGIGGYNGSAVQWYGKATDGKLYAGGGAVIIDSSGMSIQESASLYLPANAVSWLKYGSTSISVGGIGIYKHTDNSTDEMLINVVGGGRANAITLLAGYPNPEYDQASIRITNNSANTTPLINMNADMVYVSKDLRVAGDLEVYRAVPNATFTGYIFVPLIFPLTSTAWDGDARSTTGKTKIDLSAVFGTPAGIKAVLLFVWVRDSGSATGDRFLILSPENTNYVGMAIDPHPVNDRIARQTIIVPCDSNGDIYYQIGASGTNTFDVFMQIWGYWI